MSKRSLDPSLALRTIVETIDRVGLDKTTKEWPDLRLAYNQARLALDSRDWALMPQRPATLYTFRSIHLVEWKLWYLNGYWDNADKDPRYVSFFWQVNVVNADDAEDAVSRARNEITLHQSAFGCDDGYDVAVTKFVLVSVRPVERLAEDITREVLIVDDDDRDDDDEDRLIDDDEEIRDGSR